jgi:DNA repair exonuclease SbcCD nuclease subunit
MVRFVHTADFQIGKPFNWASGRAQTKLRDAREEAVGRIGEVADEHEADFVLIAGDFFDDNTVGDDVVSRTCQRLSEINAPVYILPGNHDFAGSPASVYHRPLFQRQKPEHVHVLTETEPVLVGGDDPEAADAAILPAPVERRNERGDPTRHIDAEFGPSDVIRIGLAHGGVEDFGEGEAASRIDPSRAEQADLDYLALGDWHGTKQVGKRTWYSGTPEPDSFKQNDPGHALVVEIEEPGADPTVQPVDTATYTWLREEKRLQGPEDLGALERWFEDIDDPLSVLVRLELSGSLGLEAMSDLEAMKEDLENLVLEARHRGTVRPRASTEELQQIASDGYVGDTVEALQALSDGEGDKAETADRALQLLYQFHREQEAA